MFASRGARSASRAVVAVLISLLALSGTAPSSPVAASSQIRSFTPRFQTTDRGSIALIGNTLMTCPDGNGACAAARNGTGGTINNNDFSMVYVDVDGDASTFDSSSADLSLPAGAEVLFAGLYWGAQSASASRDQVRFAVPGGSYQAVTADTVDVTGNNYAAVADVTSAVAALASPNGTYWVADVEGTPGTNQEAGWSLIVAYRDLVTPAPLRNLTVFDGYVVVNTTAPSTITTSVSGFLTPASGTVNAEMGMVTFEGDLGLTGDQFSLNGTNISNAANPLSNTFNSSISRMGTTVTAKFPNYVNQLGFDVDLLDGTGLIANSATSASLQFTSSGDTYYPTALTFAVDVFQPRLIAAKTQSDVNGGVLVAGDEIEYTVDVTNLGNDAAVDTVLTDPIPAGTTYVRGSASVLSGANAGAFTDGAGDDVGEFDAANNRVVVRLGTGATSAAGGQLDPGASTVIRFRVAVDAGLPARTHMQNQAHLSYSGLTLGGSFTANSDADDGQAGDQPTDLDLNSPPVATGDSASTPEDTPVTVDVLANDTDVDGNIDPATVAVTSGPSHGGTTVDPVTGAVTYTPDANWHGSDAFHYQVCDTAAECATASVSIDVTSVNDPPTVNADSASTVVDTPVSVDVLANDGDVDGTLDPSTVAVTGSPAHGGTSVDPVTGAITYTPDAGWTGTDEFTYRVCDDGGACGTATVTISVGVSNAPPVATDDSASTSEDTVVTIDVLANDSDPDGNLDPSTVTVTGDPSHGDTAVDPATGAATYTPDPDWNGTDSFTYRVCDTLAACDTASVSVDVTAVNDPPHAVNDGASTPEDTAVTIDVLANDIDVDGNLDPTTVSVTSGPSYGTVSVDPATGAVTDTPSPGFSGSDSFDYQVCDTDGACDTAVASVAVNWVNHVPSAVDDSASTVADVPVTVDVAANDSDPDGNLDPSTVTIVGGAAHGSVSVDPDTFLVTYTPAAGYTGSDGFSYQICDTAGACATATVTVTINAANAPPVATNDTAIVPRNGAVTIDVLANDQDPDGNLDPPTLAIARGPTSGTVRFDSTPGRITYTPTPGWSGVDTFDYLVCDTAGLCDTATVSVTVYSPSPPPSPSPTPTEHPSPSPSASPVASPPSTPVDGPPVARDDIATTPEDTGVVVDVLANDTDPHGSLVPSSIVVTNPPAYGRAVVDPATGRITYRPNAGFTGVDTLTYRVCDAAGACDSAVLTVTVASLPVTAAAAPSRGSTDEAPAGLVLAIVAAAGICASAAFDRHRQRRRIPAHHRSGHRSPGA